MENESNILKVARGHILKKLAPAVALATGLAGCATDLPTAGKGPVVSVSRLAQDLETLMKIAPYRLGELTKDAQALTFADSEDVKRKRNEYFSHIRARIDDPIQVKYDQLSSSDKRRFRAQKLQTDQLIKSAEKKIGALFDSAYLKFKPWHKERFDARY